MSVAELNAYLAQQFALNDITHFAPAEITRFIGRRHAGGAVNLEPPSHFWPRIVQTVKVLEVLREYYGRPVKITSAYRSPKYNAAIGGVKSSQHIQFRAIDFQIPGVPPKDVARKLRDLRNAGMFKGWIGLYPTFVHLDTRDSNPALGPWAN